MTNVLPFSHRCPCPSSPRDRFGLARRDMTTAFREWLATQPDGADVAEEIRTTMNTLEQLRLLAPGAE